MEPEKVTDVELYQDKIFGKKWRKLLSAYYEGSVYGKARFELYQNKAKLEKREPLKIYLAEDIMSIQPLKEEFVGRNNCVKIQLRSEEVFLAAKDVDEMVQSISRVAFPRKYVTIAPSTSLESPSEELEEIKFFKEYPVLLVPNSQQRTRSIAEGNYTLEFEETLNVKNGSTIVRSFAYGDFLWVASGEHCLGFEVEMQGIFEFICGEPKLIVEHMRNHIKFRCIFTPLRIRTANKYNRFFHPDRNASDSLNISHSSTLDSASSVSAVESSCSNVENQLPTKSTSLNDSVLSEESEKLLLQIIQKDSVEKKESSGFRFGGLFRRNSKKKKDSEKQREDFEQNADNEWFSIRPPIEPLPKTPDEPTPRPFVMTPGIENALKFRQELQDTIAKNKKRDEAKARSRVIEEEPDDNFLPS